MCIRDSHYTIQEGLDAIRDVIYYIETYDVTTVRASTPMYLLEYDCAFVDNEMPYGRVPQGHPVIVDYFYHEEIRGTENTGKRNR